MEVGDGTYREQEGGKERFERCSRGSTAGSSRKISLIVPDDLLLAAPEREKSMTSILRVSAGTYRRLNAEHESPKSRGNGIARADYSESQSDDMDGEVDE